MSTSSDFSDPATLSLQGLAYQSLAQRSIFRRNYRITRLRTYIRNFMGPVIILLT